MTNIGSVTAYLQAAWASTTPGTSTIIFSDQWFNPIFPYTPQISISDMSSPKLEAFNSAGSLTFRYSPYYVVNVWVQIPAGSSGTQELVWAENMRREVARVFRTGHNVNNYGGSLPMFGVFLPMDVGTPRHEVEKTPRCLRYEIQFKATITNE